MKIVYFVLFVLGVLAPYSQFMPWFLSNGLDLPGFVALAMDNPISLFAWMDVLLSAAACFAFIYAEGRRGGIPLVWLPVVMVLLVGVSAGLPLFLFLREFRESPETDVNAGVREAA